MKIKYPHISNFSIQQLLVVVLLLFSGMVFSQDVLIKNGVNIQASYYNNGNVNIGWELMQTYPEIEAVRIEIEPYRATQARTWIREAHENGYQVIATYHDSQQLGTDSKDQLMNAANWWKENYETFSETGPIIINIMNEWGSHDISPQQYADAYNDVIAIIREFTSDKLIVDVPGWGQATKIAADAYQYFTDQNIIYSIHVYTSAFNIEQQRWLSHEDLVYLDATGADCMVGEFCDSANGGADWCSIIDECYANGWPLFGWAWNGDGRNMNMIEPHWDDEPFAQNFRPTEFMKIVTDKLAGIACYTQPDEDCFDSMIGDRCDDGNAYTVNDRFNEFCHCHGTFTSELESNTTDADLIIFPNPVNSNQELSIELFKIIGIGQLNIINSIGKTVRSISVNRGQNSLILNTSDFQSGIYWASFQRDDKIQISKAFVVY